MLVVSIQVWRFLEEGFSIFTLQTTKNSQTDFYTQGGAQISESRPDAAPRKGPCPARNRIISGLCAATIVIEAREKSGSLITARTAAEQGREVFFVPGNPHSPRARGSNNLIRDGERILSGIEDLKEFLPISGGISKPDADNRALVHPVEIALEDGALSFETLQEKLSLSTGELLSEIQTLELEGQLRSEAGKVNLA